MWLIDIRARWISINEVNNFLWVANFVNLKYQQANMFYSKNIYVLAYSTRMKEHGEEISWIF